MKIVKLKFEVEILVPIDTKEKEQGLKEAQEEKTMFFADEEEKERIANDIAECLGLDDSNNFGIKILNENYEVIEV